VIPVVSPEGLLTADELFLLDALVSRMVVPETAPVNEMGLGL
jgi:hypothetical protein